MYWFCAAQLGVATLACLLGGTASFKLTSPPPAPASVATPAIHGAEASDK